MRVPYVDVERRFHPYRQAFHNALDRIMSHGQVILGEEVQLFEQEIAAYIGCSYAIGVANGTDALCLAMRAEEIGPGDEVITTPMSYLASTSSIALIGATPVFADVGEDLNLLPEAVEAAITPNTRAILLVHLAGNPARVTELSEIAKRHSLVLIEDCAQAIGASLKQKMVGSFGDFSTISMHPLKNLGTLGDAGVILSNDKSKRDWLCQARNHGHRSREQCDFWSYNSRLDTLHAAFLSEMLPDLPAQLAIRREQAKQYRHGLADVVSFPQIAVGAEPSYNMFMILAEERDSLRHHLAENGIETFIHYPIPIHQLNATRQVESTLPNAEYYSKRILSLPLGEHLTPEQIDLVIEGIRNHALHHRR